MAKSKKQERKVCTSHTFSIKPKQNHVCYYQQAISIKFCCNSYCQGGSVGKNSRSCYEGPVFNKDKNFSTPSFIVNSDKLSYMQNANKGKAENDKKFINYSDQKSQLYEPKPNSKNMYCSVCKERYEDYRDHIRSDKHKKKIKNHTFSGYIMQIQSKYNKTRRQRIKRKQKDLVQTNDQVDGVIIITSEGQQIQNQSQVFMKPRKKVKLDKAVSKNQQQNTKNVFTQPSLAIFNQYFHPPHNPVFYPNYGANLPYQYQAYQPHYQASAFNNPLFQYQLNFNPMMANYFPGLMGHYNDGFLQQGYHHNFQYNTTDATFQKQIQRIEAVQKQNFIIVDDERQ